MGQNPSLLTHDLFSSLQIYIASYFLAGDEQWLTRQNSVFNQDNSLIGR
ncbi:Bgt-20855 [Blumeria graminis f. sp. tritici]|uniref:Bgt-20855 n=2 Tax=Blumeria graminis f. sp. tritici TaxID=62690 RepID=A0A9X9MP26_BLUGR|nr:Bgt-20855 [Blumeria graminis f. sp. tritici]